MTPTKKFSALSRANQISTHTIPDPEFDKIYQREFKSRRAGNNTNSVKLLQASFKSAIFSLSNKTKLPAHPNSISIQNSATKTVDEDVYRKSEKFFDHIEKNIRKESLLESSRGRRAQSQSLVGIRGKSCVMEGGKRRVGGGGRGEEGGRRGEGKGLGRILTPKEFTVIEGRESEGRREGRKLEAKVSLKMGLSGS